MCDRDRRTGCCERIPLFLADLGGFSSPARCVCVCVCVCPCPCILASAIYFSKEPTPQDALNGRSAMMSCEVNIPTNVVYSWLRNGEPVHNTERRFQEGSDLKFTAIDRHLDTGMFQCVASNTVTGETARSVNASFNIKWLESGGVTLKEPASEAKIESSQPVTLRCHIDGHPRPNYKWYKDGVQLTERSHQINNKERTLTVKSASPDDSGLYYCCAHNPLGQVCSNKNFTLDIVDKSFPVPVVVPEDQVVFRNQEAVFHCQFTAEPPPMVQWFHESEPVFNKTRLILYNNGTLLITQVKQRSTGTYRCVAHGPTGRDVTLQATLYIAEINEMDPIMPRVFTADTLERVKCYPPSGHPEPEVWWEHRGRRVPTVGRVYQDGTDLVFSPTNGSDSDSYTCVAKNKAGERRQQLTVTVANGSPLPPWVEQKEGTLRFGKVLRSDAGNYTCTASNSLQGEIRAFVSLTVAVSIEFKMVPEYTTVYQGHTAILHCQATGDPSPHIQWMRGDLRFMVRLMPNGSLVISGVTTDDTGRYTCVAGNSCGISDSSTQLYVVEKPIHLDSDQDKTPYKMIQTIGLSVGVAVAYIIAVLGLMFYCKQRRNAKRLQKSQEGEEPEMECLNGGAMLHNGQTTAEIQEEVALTNLGTTASAEKRHSSNDKLHFPRVNLQTITTLGKGEFGEVLLAKAKGIVEGEEQTLVLVKSLQARDEQLQQDFRREADMFAKLSHPNVVQLLGLCRDAEPHYIILEYMDLGDLKQFVRISKGRDEKMKSQALSTKTKVSLCMQVAQGMEHLSNQRFVHRDLAARNCMISDQRHVKVSALGLSKDVYKSEYYHYRQAWIPLRWMPTEAVFEDDFSTKSDVWSFGVLMWEVFSYGELPYTKLSNDQVLEGLQSGKLKLPPLDCCPFELHRLLEQCWAPSPKERPTFSELVHALANLPSDSKV
uniref:Protein tyrosine kinase 7 (inactive) n=1 Tax=Denticeps clupeoides TaxID=299321 RepID=A0AAY4EHC3_9TELE